MAAKDYTFGAGCFGTIYLTKRTKPLKNGRHIMSNDRRELEANEIFYIFENYLRYFCDVHNTDTMQVTGENGKVIFEATLKDKDEQF